MGVTRELAEFVAQARYNDLPPTAVHMVKRCLLAWLGNAIAASRDPSASILLEALENVGGSQQATVVGKGRRSSVLHAALINGYLSHFLDFDDTHVPTVLHPTSPVMPAAMALAESRRLSGKHLISAFALGVDIETRIAMAICPSHYEAGWHVTGTVGPLGAAAAAGVLLGLNSQQLLWAFGLAAAMPVGLRENFGTMGKAFHPGMAAHNGLLAATLAEKGLTASENILEGPNGYLRAMSAAPNPEVIARDLGMRYYINDVSFKPYACGVVNHPLIDGVLQLRLAYSIRAEDVTTIDARMSATQPVPQLAANPQPETGLSGKFSLAHCSAVALTDGAAGPLQFTDERATDPTIRDIRAKFRVELDKNMGEHEAHVAIILKGGQRVEVYVTHATGTPENPMSDAALETKFRNAVDEILPRGNGEELLHSVSRLEDVEDVGEIMRHSG